jgi:hypothetical protein
MLKPAMKVYLTKDGNSHHTLSTSDNGRFDFSEKYNDEVQGLKNTPKVKSERSVPIQEL